MKKLQFLTYLFAALLMVTTVSCDDDDDDKDATPDKESLLTADVWQGDKVYYQGTDITEDFTPFLDVKNSTIKFDTDGTYTVVADGTTEEGTWAFVDAEQEHIVMDEGTDDELTVEVKRLTSTELWVEGDYVDMGEDIEIRFVR